MKWKDKGYWVSHHFYWQSLAYYFLLSARFRSFTFFAAGDPGIDMGGMLDERKSDIYRLFPSFLIPDTISIDGGSIVTAKVLQDHKMFFPLIVKPDIGFRGYMVRKVNDLEDLNEFLTVQQKERKWLIQEFLDYKREFSLLYYRIPGKGDDGISSFTEKIYPQLSGDGRSSLKDLLKTYQNPFLDWQLVNQRWAEKMNWVPAEGEKVILDEIGNYARGSKFYSKNHLIEEKLLIATRNFFLDVEGMDFFRIDFKADSIDDYISGNFKILEINGMKSEPIHNYDPGSTFWGRTKVIHRHWMIIKNIVKARLKHEGFTFPSTKYGLTALASIKNLVK